jgi:hypothetical protein
MVDLGGGGVGQSYRPSGRVNVLLFVPLFLISLVIAFGMALLLYAVSGSWYLFFITPLLLCLPVLGGIFVTIRGGRCRSGILAAVTGLALMLAYYGGYWYLNYFAFLSYYEDKAQPILEYETGSQGFWGFIQFYCQNSTVESYPNPISKEKEPDKADEIFSYVFYSGELIVLLAIGMRMSYMLTQRVFYERIKRWAGAKKLKFMVSDLPELQRIIDRNDWPALQKLSKLPSLGQQTAYLEFIIEYPQKPDAALPVYLSIKSTHSPDKIKQKDSKGIMVKYIIRQKAVDEIQLQKIAEVLPEMKFPCSGQAAGVSAAVQQGRPQQGASGKADFRDIAVAASLSQMGHWSSVNVSEMDASLCLSIPDEHRVSVKKMAITKIGILVIGFLCFGGGIGIMILGTQFTVPLSEDLTPLGITITSMGGACCVAAVLLVFGQIYFFTTLLKRRLLGRAGCLFEKAHLPKLRMALLEDSKTYHLGKLATEDICLVHIDKSKQRLVLEGCNHRYIIRGRDITRLEPVKSGPEIAIGIYFKIGDTELPIVLQVESMKWYVLNPLFSMNSAGRFVKRLSADLGVQI